MRPLLLAISLLASGLLLSVCQGRSLPAEKISLNGDWEFYWMQFLDPAADGAVPSETAAGRMRVPGAWEGLGTAGTQPSGQGYATYRRVVRFEEWPRDPVLYLFALNSAYRLYCNGRLCAENGSPGKDSAGEVPRRGSSIVRLQQPDPGGRIELVLHISNFHHRSGGIWRGIEIGPGEIIQTEIARRNAFEMFLIGALFIMGIYHLVIAFRRRRDQAPLFFGLFCLVFVLRALSTAEGTLMRLHAWLFDFEWSYRLEYLGFYAGVPLVLSFLHSMFPREFAPRPLRAIQVVCALFVLLVLLTPALVFTRSLVYFYGVLTFCVLYGVYGMSRAVWRRREGAKSFFFGLAILTATMVHDILANTQVTEYFLLSPLGVFIFVFSQAALLSRRFATAFSTAESLAGELEERVTRRTADLEASRREARAEKERSEIARSRIEQLHGFARRLNAAGEVSRILEEIYAYVGHYFEPRFAWIFLVDQERKRFDYRPGGSTAQINRAGLDWLRSVRDMRLDPDAGLIYSTIHKGRMVYYSDVERFRDRMAPMDVEGVIRLELKDVLYIPLMTQDRCVALLGMTGMAPGLVKSLRLYLHLFAEEAAGALQRALLARKDEENEVRLAAIGRMASGIVHDLKNPMAVIKLYAEMSDDESVGRDNRRKYLESISREIDRLTDMTFEIMDFAGGVNQLEAEPVSPGELIAELLTFHGAELEEAGIEASTAIEFTGDIPLDRDRMRRALGNLIANAREVFGSRSMRDPGRPAPKIVVGVHARNGNVSLYVTDNGPGIPPEIQERVFDSFVTGGKKRGTGLGLSVVRTVAEAHGGSADFETGAHGTTFRIQLPLST